MCRRWGGKKVQAFPTRDHGGIEVPAADYPRYLGWRLQTEPGSFRRPVKYNERFRVHDRGQGSALVLWSLRCSARCLVSWQCFNTRVRRVIRWEFKAFVILMPILNPILRRTAGIIIRFDLGFYSKLTSG